MIDEPGPVDRELLLGPAPVVAPRLLGTLLRLDGTTVRITEVEAYAGELDPASHSFRGRTDRNAVMFGPPGHLYLYFSYGMHWAANVSCGPDGVGSGILLRAGEVVDGLEAARLRRGRIRDRDLARGPGRLTQALGLRPEHKDIDLLGSSPVLLVRAPGPVSAISAGPRVGVSKAADRPWRFWITGDPYVSAYSRSPRAPAAGASD